MSKRKTHYVYLVALDDDNVGRVRVFESVKRALKYVEQLFEYMNLRPSTMDGELMECERVLTTTDDVFEAQGICAARTEVK